MNASISLPEAKVKPTPQQEQQKDPAWHHFMTPRREIKGIADQPKLLAGPLAGRVPTAYQSKIPLEINVASCRALNHSRRSFCAAARSAFALSFASRSAAIVF